MDCAISARSTTDSDYKSEDKSTVSNDQEDSFTDVSRKNWEISLFESSSPSNGLSVYRNAFHLMPSSVGKLGGLKKLKFLANDIEVLPPEAGDLVNLERLQVKILVPGLSGLSFEKWKCLKELELCRVPPRPLALSLFGEIGTLQCLTKLSICHFPIRYLPPEIGCLKKLEELDLSFNKLKNLPNDIGELNALKSLRVANNKLVDLPSGISSLRRLEILDLSNNRLTSLTQLKLASMQTLQYLNLQYNKLHYSCQIPSWIFCKFGENEEDISKDDADISLVEVNAPNMAVHRAHGNRSCNSCHNISSCFCLEGSTSCRCSLMQRMKKGWKRRDYLQQRARQERLNYSRKWRADDHSDNMIVKMAEEDDSCISTLLDEGQSELQINGEEKLMDHPAVDEVSQTVDGVGSVTSGDIHLMLRMKKGWKRRDYLQQRARQERLNYSRKWRADDHSDNMIVKMAEEDDSCISTLLDEGQSELQINGEEKLMDHPAVDEVSQTVDGVGSVTSGDIHLFHPDCDENGKIRLNKSYGDESSCVTECTSSNKENYYENASVSSPQNELTAPDDNSSAVTIKFIVKSKRHSDRDLDNPKPRKFRRPVDDSSFLSCKYSTESFCSIDDHLPDGFYDAGRNRPFMSLKKYEQSLCIDSREVILLDRDRDEELDAIASSAQMLLSSFRRSSCPGENKDYEVDNLQRASMLALFVSDCFGGSDRSASVIKLRKAVVGSNKQQPFICTCWAGNIHDKGEMTKQAFSMAGNFNFNELCESSLRVIKSTRNSNVVPIGTLRFGVCRHRAVLMKYLCDRADPPIPCELVRGYLDFMPHAWNAIHVRKGNSWVRMVVDACYPTDIREETDVEYYCRYIPLCRVHLPLTTENSSLFGYSFPSPSLSNGTEKAQSRSVFRCKFGTLDAAVKVRNLESFKASPEEIRAFEYSFLGEVRMLGALRRHSCIVEIYGHQLSSKWAPPVDGIKENRLLQSIIVTECIKGGSVKNYLDKLLERGEKHVPADIAVCIARDVACALVELHSKHIIHRDIKSENVLIDLDCKRSDGSPVVKLADFDRSVPLQSFMHSCCNAHLGIHPPDVCVGTPRWMAPEVVQAMHRRNPYGLEVDIWSYGCLLYELVTLQVPYNGQSEAEIYSLLQMKRRPRLTPELEAVAFFDEVEAGSDAGSDAMRLLVELFYECTSSDPSDRPTAEYIYDKLIEVSKQPHAAQTEQQQQQQQLM